MVIFYKRDLEIIKNPLTFFCVSQIKLEFGKCWYYSYFEDRGKLKYLEKDLSEHGKEPTTYSGSHVSMLEFQPGPNRNVASIYAHIMPVHTAEIWDNFFFCFQEALLSWNRDNE